VTWLIASAVSAMNISGICKYLTITIQTDIYAIYWWKINNRSEYTRMTTVKAWLGKTCL
jgi:hypothetical protein